ncbi:tetratricopeptide repeat protein [Streptomyces sp. NBC_00568]|uniref:tetratricopeptide repeat protein n=1 Tax=Streptomyces sp. NBC_00568 TaxID=2975779 RepID=UPI00225A80C5|nr:tetratricopeptide repeat protein [Streptomyces sp. NBC_00568]MCX4993473.1 tetratricopeptide repeat protein [Streptomyces sp. NBC_00568]
MEFDRRVQVRLHTIDRWTQEPTKTFGSGYLVAPRLVLTAAHVLGDASGPWPGTLMVARPQPPLISQNISSRASAGPEPQQALAAVRWYRKDDLVDAALLELCESSSWQTPESLYDTVTRPPQRWGVLIGPRPHPVTVLGFPRMQKDAAARRLDEQLTGEINPGSGSLAHRYEISSTSPALDALLGPDAPGTPWSGMSGAAVHAHDLLCGVTRRDRQAINGTRLTATPAALLLADDDFRAIVTERASGWDPVLEPVEPAGLLTPAAPERDPSSAAALLRADTGAVAFYGREQELADLRAWCEGDPPALSVRVLTGPGGQGKTRLARHLTDILSRAGWVTGHLRSDLTDQDPPPDFAPLTTAHPLLLVIDYAETRPRLLRRLIAHLHRSSHRVRLLLLARSDGEWRTDALSATPRTRTLLKAAQITELTALFSRSRSDQDRPDQDRVAAFTEAAADLARLLPHVPSLPVYDWSSLAATLQPPEDLSETQYDNILTLQMTALVSLLQHGPKPVQSTPGAPPEEVLLEHEERFWEDSATTPAFKMDDLSTPALAGAVAVAALCGASDRDEALHVTEQVPDLPDQKVARTAAWLAMLYPAGDDRYWGSLQPDRIAEYHASRTVITGHISLPAVLAAASPGQQGQLIIVLSRASIAHYNAQRTADSAQILKALDSALETTTPHRQALQTAIAALPDDSHITNGLALSITTALTRTGGSVDKADLARWLSNRAARLLQVGGWEEALTVTEEAVQIYRRLVTANPAAHEPDLASSLSNLGITLSDAGRWEEALTAEEEAVEIRRRLATANPTAYEPDLASSQSNLGIRLSEVGRWEEALTVTEEAVGIRRRLATANPTAYEPDLATSLSNLGNRLSDTGRWEEALTAEEEAVGIRRRLATANPAHFEPDLASSLSNLGASLWKAGRREEALTVTEEAAGIYRRLATANPTAYEPRLAAFLSNLGAFLPDAGRWEEALAAAEEAVEIRRRLVTANPAAHEPDLASSLSNLGITLSDAGRWEEALTAEEEAVEIRRRLATANPTAYEPDLASSQSNLGIRLSEVGRWEEALTVTEEAVGIRRRLATANPTAYEPDLATSLSNLGNRLSDTGRWEEALTVEEEALTVTGEAAGIYRRLATANPTAYEPDLASSLSNLGASLWKAGRREEALTVTEEAVGIYRRLATANPTVHEPDLATSLSNLGVFVSRVGRWEEALTVTEEAVEIYRRLATANPTAYEPHLAIFLSNLGIRLSKVERWEEALTVTGEAVEIDRRLATANPTTYEPSLADSLDTWARIGLKMQLLQEALRATGESIELYRKLVAVAPAKFTTHLRAVLTLQADLLDRLRRNREAGEIRRWLLNS